MTASESVVEGRLYNALWWAKVQSGGPLQVSPDTPAVAGLTRAAEPDGSSVWMLPTLPDGAGHSVLEELGTPPVAVEQPNETARVLAICVTCCWPDRDGPTWPGAVGTLTQIKAVYAGLRGRPEQSSDLTLIIGSLRRLHATHWLLWNEKAAEVRLGPRVVTWGPSQLAGLRELCRVLPDPPPAVLVSPTTPAPDPDPLPADDATPEHPPADADAPPATPDAPETATTADLPAAAEPPTPDALETATTADLTAAAGPTNTPSSLTDTNAPTATTPEVEDD